jgi:hypothetical protein
MASGHAVLGLSDHRLLGVEVLLLLMVVYLGVKGSTVRRLVWWKARYLIPRFFAHDAIDCQGCIEYSNLR